MYINWNWTKNLIYCIYLLTATFKVHWPFTVKCSYRDIRLRDSMFESHATVCIGGLNVKLLFPCYCKQSHGFLMIVCMRRNNCFSPMSMFFFLFTLCTYKSIKGPRLNPNLSKTFEFRAANISIQKIPAVFLLYCFSSYKRFFSTCTRYHPNTPEIGLYIFLGFQGTHFTAER